MLYPYQQRWLQSQSRFKIGMFARQTGKTFTTTLDIVLGCLSAATDKRPERCNVVAWAQTIATSIDFARRFRGRWQRRACACF